MNKKGIFIICMLMSVCVPMLFAQSEDSLMQKFRSDLAKIEVDTARIDFMHKEGMVLSFADPTKGLKIIRESEQLSLKIKDPIRIIRSKMLLGIVFRNQAAYDFAIEQFLETARLSDSIGSQVGIGSSYNNIATIQSQQGQRKEAIISYRKARKILKGEDMAPQAVIPLLNIATSLYELGEYDQSLAVFDTVITELKFHEDKRGLSIAYNNLSSLYGELGDMERSREYFNDALALKKEIMDVVGQADVLQNFGKALTRIGKLNEASELLNESLKLAKKTQAKLQEYNAYKLLGELYAKQKEPEKALAFFKQYESLKDSLNSEQLLDRIAKLQTVYEVQRRDTEIALLNKNNEVERANSEKQWYITLFLMGGFGLLAVTLIIVVLNNRARKRAYLLLERKNKEITSQRKEILSQNEELTVQNDRLEELNHEINGLLHVVAHDLKAPLNRTSGLAHLVEISGPLNEEQAQFIGLIEKVNKDAGVMIRDLLDLHQIEQPETFLEFEEFSLSQLIQESAQSFMLEAQRKGINMQTLLPDEEIEVISDEKSLNRILDNLISNALKFSQEGKNVEIGAAKLPEGFRIWVKDEGQGIREEDKSKMFRKFQKLAAQPTGGESSSGLGLAIIKTIADKLNGTIHVESEWGVGTKFTLEFPHSPLPPKK